MKNINLVLFSVLFSAVIGFVFMKPMLQHETITSYKIKNKLPLEQRADGIAQIRQEQLKNVTTGKVDANDWYKALGEISAMPKSQLSARGDALKWENQGPDQVGGRTRAFIFDKTKEGRMYTGGVSGGVFVSENFGHSFAPVKDMVDSFPIMSISCMAQSKDGDVYAGTGEFWGNTPNGQMGSQFYGNGIYKKNKADESWTLLRSTVTSTLTNAQNNGNFQQVVDISSDNADNETIYAATTKGLFITKDGGATWIKNSKFSSMVAQIKVAKNGDLYAGNAGKVWKSKDKGATWTDIIGNRPEYTAGGNGHLRIALSQKTDDKLYVCGIDGNNDLKYVIKSIDGGGTWTFLGKADVTFNPLCNEINGQRSCQGWYDLCLAVHPNNDDLIYLGGAPAMYSWSQQYGWVQMSYGYAPGVLGVNQVHADMHDFAFHPTNPDTMVIVNDGGIYISYNSTKAFPNVTWKPIYTKYNVTQFYDVAVNKYGELVGGTQDNGSQFVTLRGANSNLSFEIQGGDGFDAEISAANDHLVAYTTSYNGKLARTSDMSTNRKSIASGCIAKGADIANVGFHSRIHLAESVVSIPGEKDTLEHSILFAFDASNSFTASNNAHKVTEPTKWSFWSNAGAGTILSAHQSKNLSVLYMCGTSGVRKTTALRNSNIWIPDLAAADQPCLKAPVLGWTSVTGTSGNIADVYVDQSDDNHVIAVQFGFGGVTKVFESTNGTSFVGKQGNLPVMPVYSCAIDPTDRKHVVVATEFGIWETMDISAASPVWAESNTNIGRVPVFKLRVNYLREENCTVLYAGTHGRGFFRAPFPDKGSAICDYTKKARVSTNGINPVQNMSVKFDIYPNPSSDNVNVTFNSKNIQTYTLAIYNMVGKLVKKMEYKSFSGDNIITTDISGLMNGNYILRLEDNNTVIGGKIMTKK
jgi:hypothetical protein